MQLIELWETFLMQLDAEEDGQPFPKPATATPQAPLVDTGKKPARSENPEAAAATATVDQEA